MRTGHVHVNDTAVDDYPCIGFDAFGIIRRRCDLDSSAANFCRACTGVNAVARSGNMQRAVRLYKAGFGMKAVGSCRCNGNIAIAHRNILFTACNGMFRRTADGEFSIAFKFERAAFADERGVLFVCGVIRQDIVSFQFDNGYTFVFRYLNRRKFRCRGDYRAV
ncbi:hypothetical protein Barb4_00980 [Bacteroidales bacterium Barb4]|nr:hypothetical protein Barb4_00980 [Bacteroidales bacterium Barb4]